MKINVTDFKGRKTGLVCFDKPIDDEFDNFASETQLDVIPEEEQRMGVKKPHARRTRREQDRKLAPSVLSAEPVAVAGPGGYIQSQRTTRTPYQLVPPAYEMPVRSLQQHRRSYPEGRKQLQYHSQIPRSRSCSEAVNKAKRK